MITFLFCTADTAVRLLCQLSCRWLGIVAGRYVYMQDLQQLNHPPPHLPHPLPRWPHYQSPVRISPLSHYLRLHPDQEFVSYILHGLASGFHIGYSARRVTLLSSLRNHQSSLANPQVISDYIGEEVALGRMVGPLPSAMRSVLHCSPTGLVPKGRESGQWRMIVDLSFPCGGSVNDGIPREPCSLRYASVDEALQFITKLGCNTLLLKIDLKSAYRMVPVHLGDRRLLGISWEGEVYVDQALPFGLRSAPKLFTVWLMQ